MRSLENSHLRTDVLVLGSGLSGLRAAWAALEAYPRLKVMIVSCRSGPSGSSFASLYDRLGMQVCHTDEEKERFFQDAISIAPPGEIFPDLVRIMASESQDRFQDLLDVGFKFKKDSQGNFYRWPGCFNLHKPRAYRFFGLSSAFIGMKNRVLSLGGSFHTGWLVQDLIIDLKNGSKRICGALLKRVNGKERLAVEAKSIIMALGGPAPLYAWHQAGPGTPGYSLALLHRAGAKLINTGFLQFMWARLRRRHLWPVEFLSQPGYLIRNPNGVLEPLPEHLRPLAKIRATHAPFAYNMDDAAIDHFLGDRLTDRGWVKVFSPSEGWLKLAPMAHATNGGASIDMNGFTGVPGLYACGECASGMHGANRIGGAMVLATQVFGARAGKAAAGYSYDTSFLRSHAFNEFLAKKLEESEEENLEWLQGRSWLKHTLQEKAVLGGRSDLYKLKRDLEERLKSSTDWKLRLYIESALILVEFLCKKTC